jgi:hypothetical protein
MEREELRYKQSQFEGTRQDKQTIYKNFKKIQRQFVQKFPLTKIRSLTIDDYVEGKRTNGEPNKDSFCYWVEWKTTNLGRMQGARADKFGLYCDKATQQYKYVKRFENENIAIRSLKEEIIKLIEYGRNKDLENIKKVKLSKMFKGKILFLYYPDKFVNIFSEKHVDYFLEKLDLIEDNADKMDLIDKRELLSNFKNNDEIMRNWNMFEFSNFLYNTFGRPADKNKTPRELKEYIDFSEDYPKMNKVSPVFIELNINTQAISIKEKTKDRQPRIVDFEKENKRNKKIGDQGELIVKKMEIEHLKSNGKRDLAANVKRISKENVSAGYDILSFEMDGTEKYIEVKSTSNSPSNVANFIITDNEYRKAKELDNYYLYIVFEVKSTEPKIWKIKNPANLEGKGLVLRPLSFKAAISIQNT